MTWLAGPYAAFAALVVLGGAPKVLRPGPTSRAVRSAGLPAGDHVVRAFGAAEVVAGLGALLVGGRGAAVALALSYAGFTAFVVLAMRRGGAVSSCGCFGTPDTPPTWAHVVVDAVAALVAAGMVLGPAHAPVEVLGHTPWAGLPLLALTALAAWLGYLALTALPMLFAPRATPGAAGLPARSAA